MFNKISNLSIDIFNESGTQFIGEAKFDLPAESEKSMLQLINYNVQPNTLTLNNLDFYQPSANYIAPNINAPIRRSGVIKAILTDDANGFQVPVLISLKYDAQARHSGENPYFFDSVGYTNISVGDIRALTPLTK